MAMKKMITLASSATVLACSMLPLQSHAASDGFYAGVFGGPSITPSFSDKSDNITGEFTFEKPAAQAGAQLGYKSGPLRYEAEALYSKSKFKNASVADMNIPGFGGSMKLYSGLANVIYDIDAFGDNAQPYVGAGIGYGRVEANPKITASGVTVTDSSHVNEFAYQGIAGMNVSVSDNADLFADYRYVGTSKRHLDQRFQNHTFNIGVNFKLDA